MDSSPLLTCAPPAAGKWHLDEVQLKSNGKKHWMWLAGDQDELVLDILDILVQERHNQECERRRPLPSPWR